MARKRPGKVEAELLDAVEHLRPWKRGGQRAPHKPLLLLLALGRAQRGEPRLVPFVDVEYLLSSLLARFGPSRRSHHPEYPFWRLQNDGLWEIPGGEALPRRKSNSESPCDGPA